MILIPHAFISDCSYLIPTLRNLKKEIKVAQLVGSVSEISGYHHGEASLAGTIINLAQNFVGSNNLNLLEPNGKTLTLFEPN